MSSKTLKELAQRKYAIFVIQNSCRALTFEGLTSSQRSLLLRVHVFLCFAWFWTSNDITEYRSSRGQRYCVWSSQVHEEGASEAFTDVGKYYCSCNGYQANDQSFRSHYLIRWISCPYCGIRCWAFRVYWPYLIVCRSRCWLARNTLRSRNICVMRAFFGVAGQNCKLQKNVLHERG